MHTRSRSFYTLLIGALAGLVFVGFARTYYLKPLFATPALTPLVHLHAITFTAWIAVFFVQVRLVAANKVSWHRRLGPFAVVLAILMVTIGVATAIEAGRSGVMRGGLTSREHMAIPLTGIALFAAFAGAGLALRRRPAIHKRLMILAVLGVLGPAIGRLSPTLGAQLLVLIAVLLSLLAYDYLRERRVHLVFLSGGALLLASWPLRFALARSDAWQRLTSLLM